MQVKKVDKIHLGLDSSAGRAPDSWWKVASSNPGRNGGILFFFRFNVVCWLLFRVRSTPVLPRWHVKDHVILPNVQVAGWCIHPWPNEVGVGWLCCSGIVWGIYQGNKLTRNSPGNIRPQPSQLTRPLCTDPGLKSEIVVRGARADLHMKKKMQAVIESSKVSSIPLQKKRSTRTTTNPRILGKRHPMNRSYPSSCFIILQSQPGKLLHTPPKITKWMKNEVKTCEF